MINPLRINRNLSILQRVRSLVQIADNSKQKLNLLKFAASQVVNYSPRIREFKMRQNDCLSNRRSQTGMALSVFRRVPG